MSRGYCGSAPLSENVRYILALSVVLGSIGWHVAGLETRKDNENGNSLQASKATRRQRSLGQSPSFEASANLSKNVDETLRERQTAVQEAGAKVSLFQVGTAGLDRIWKLKR